MGGIPVRIAEDASAILANLKQVRSNIAQACDRVGRDPAGIRLLPVTKTLSVPRIRAAYRAGLREFGENKLQEARGKAEALSDLPVRWSIVGHLQTNKARYLARFAAEFQALDSLKVAETLEKRLQVEGRGLDIFVQVNTSGEQSKFGLAPEQVAAFVRELSGFSSLRIKGLMTLAIFSPDEERVRRCFSRLRQLRERLQQEGGFGSAAGQLSMGMSGDYEWAIEEGSTVIRVGQAIFGPRPLPDSHYWPEAAGGKDSAGTSLFSTG